VFGLLIETVRVVHAAVLSVCVVLNRTKTLTVVVLLHFYIL